MNRSIVLLLLPLAACAGGPKSIGDYETVAVPDEQARQKALREAEARRRDFEGTLLKLDQAMESYARALANRGISRADTTAEQLEKMIRDTVLDRDYVAYGKGLPNKPIGDIFHRLQAAAIDGINPYHQGIALAALGFSDDKSVMDTILQGAQLEEPTLIDRAVFGLAMLRAPNTPPGVLARIIEDNNLPDASRTQAAWALYRLQGVSTRTPEIVTAWRRVLGEGLVTPPPGVLVQAVRGIGLTRDAANADLIAPKLRDPTALVRMAAADGLARMNSQRHADDLIVLLGPEESVPNVRLHARKALQELAGRVDYGYDVAAWRKAFIRK